MIKRIVSILLALVMFATLLPAGLIGTAEAAESTGAEAGVSRIEWVQQLVETFNMTVEEDNYPDNYYSDMDESSPGYRDLLVAVEFGVIDLEAGSAFEPEQPATREFAAHTLNYCLGFQLDNSTYTYADTADVTYADDVQVAVNRGWLTLVNGRFLPQRALTSAEATAMLADAAQVLKGLVVSESYNNTYTFKADVIEIPNGTDVLVDESTVRITNCPKTLTNGCIFVVYVNDIPVPYIATAVAVKGNVTVVTATRAEDADAFEVFDAQGVVDADLTQVEALDGTELSYYVEELDQEFQTYAMARDAVARIGGTTSPKIELSCKRELTLLNGVKLSLDVKIKKPTISYSISMLKGEAYVKLSYDISVNYKVKGDLATGSNINDIKLIYWGVPGVGGFVVTYDVELSGSITGIQEWHVDSGISASIKDGISFPRTFQAKAFSLVVELTCQVGFQAKLGITELPVFNAYLYAKMGCVGKVKGQTYNDNAAPHQCVNMAGYLYASYGATGSVKFGNYKKSFSIEHKIYDEKNSPIRIVHHYEDGTLVPSCMRGGDSGSGQDDLGLGSWRTPADSRYTSSGWSSGFGSKAYDKSGNPVTLYTYTLDDDDNATITAYKGNATALVIPSTIDGYTVVAIGNGAFRGNVKLAAVMIPDTVTKIEDSAFSGCTGLTDISLPKNLKTLGVDAFYGCSGLTSVLIPKTVENTQHYYNGRFSPFRGCNNLQTFRFEDGMTRIPDTILCYCTAKLDIVIPDSVTEIGDSAFRNSGLVTVTIPDTVTKIEDSAFSGCTGLTSMMVPDSVTDMGTGVFANCTSLTNVTLPNIRQNIVASTFEGCTSLEKIVLPETVTAIRDSAFKNCTALKEIVWSKAPGLIEANAFYNCDALTEVEIPTTVTSVGDQAFYDCDSLTTVDFPDTVTKMGTKVFYDCDALTSVKLGSGITTIPASTFEHCDVLESIVIPRRVTTIGNSAFKDCVKFTSITIPRSVTSIGSTAFSYLNKLTIYGVAGTYAETYANDNGIKFVDKQVGATDITLDPARLTINKGASAMLTLTIKPEDFTDTVSWKSSDTSVVTVSDTGVVKGVGLGTATIKVVVGSKSASCTVIVQQPVTSISLNSSSRTIDALETFQLTATANPSTAVDRRVSWSSSDPAIASVDANGLVTAYKKGSAVITVSAMDGSGVTATCKITVANNGYVCTSPTQMESPHNYPNNCGDAWIYTAAGATSLKVTFDKRTNMESGFDYLYIYNAAGEQVGKYTGTSLAGKTISVTGPSVKIKLVSDDSGNEWGFKVTGITVTSSAAPTAPVVRISNSAASGKPMLTWNAVEGATSYRIYRSTSKGSGYSLLGTTTATSYTNTGAKAGTTYYYRVKAVNDAGLSPYSNIVSGQVKSVTPKPAAPVVKIGHSAASGKPMLTWNAVSGATSYKVYRATSQNGAYSLLGSVTVTSYTNTGAKDGVTYYYKVTAVNDSGESAYSNIVSGQNKAVTPKPSAPVVKIGHSASSGKPMLTWNAVSGATSYKVYRATSQNGTYSLLGTVTATSYTNTGAKAGTTYYYKVKAVSSAGESAYSNIVSGKSKAVTPKPSAPVVKIGHSATSGKPMLTWNAVDGAASYRVYRATAKNGAYSVINTTKALTYTNTGAPLGTTYYYKVEALNAAGKSLGFSAVVEGKVAPVLAVGYSSVSGKPQLTWKAIPGATEYQVYRSTQQNSGYTKINTTTSTSYVNTGAKANTTYYYRIVAVKGTAVSDFSNIVSARPSK